MVGITRLVYILLILFRLLKVVANGSMNQCVTFTLIMFLVVSLGGKLLHESMCYVYVCQTWLRTCLRPSHEIALYHIFDAVVGSSSTQPTLSVRV